MAKRVMWAVVGAVSFWIPVVLLFAIQGAKTNVPTANILAILGFAACLLIRRRLFPAARLSVWMLLGLYFLGPIFLSTATTFVNGGFAQMHGWTDIRWFLLELVFPPLHFFLAAMSGLWPSLLLVTIMLVGSVAVERRTGVQQPR